MTRRQRLRAAHDALLLFYDRTHDRRVIDRIMWLADWLSE